MFKDSRPCWLNNKKVQVDFFFLLKQDLTHKRSHGVYIEYKVNMLMLEIVWLLLILSKRYCGPPLCAPTTTKIFQMDKKWRKCGVWNDKCLVWQGECLELKILGHNSVAFGIQGRSVHLKLTHMCIHINKSHHKCNPYFNFHVL